MASPLSILKSVLNLNHNYMHVSSLEEKTVTVHRSCETYEQSRIYVHARPYKKVQKLCPICRKKCSGYDTKHDTESMWRAPNLNGVPVYICYQPHRIQCPEHGILTEYIPWADGNSRFTEDFNNEVAWMVCQMPRSSIALFEDIDWRTVGNCIKAAHDRIEPDVTIRMHDLRRICVDETSYRKGFTYITVVYDMDRNRVVWVHPGNGLEIFRLFCEALSIEERNKIEIVAGDGAQWIDTCTKLYFPNATRCIDFFHVAEWANEALDKVRVSTANKAATEYEQRKREFQEAEAEAEKAAAENVDGQVPESWNCLLSSQAFRKLLWYQRSQRNNSDPQKLNWQLCQSVDAPVNGSWNCLHFLQIRRIPCWEHPNRRRGKGDVPKRNNFLLNIRLCLTSLLTKPNQSKGQNMHSGITRKTVRIARQTRSG